jgi:hypothetical protein
MIAVAVAAALAAQAATAASPCELHLFARDLGVGPQPAGNLLVKPLPPSDDPLAFVNVMSPQDRMADAGDADYIRALGLPENTPVVRHWDVVLPFTVQKSQGALIATPGRCHSELIGYSATGLMASRSRTGRDEVNIDLVFRQFAADGVLEFDMRVSGYGRVDTEKKVGREAALQSLHAASIAIVDDIGQRIVKLRSKAR